MKKMTQLKSNESESFKSSGAKPCILQTKSIFEDWAKPLNFLFQNDEGGPKLKRTDMRLIYLLKTGTKI